MVIFIKKQIEPSRKFKKILNQPRNFNSIKKRMLASKRGPKFHFII